MGRVKLKTQRNNGDVDKFLDSIKDGQHKKDAKIVTQMTQEATGESPMAEI